jgi:hypothetical protein
MRRTGVTHEFVHSPTELVHFVNRSSRTDGAATSEQRAFPSKEKQDIRPLPPGWASSVTIHQDVDLYIVGAGTRRGGHPASPPTARWTAARGTIMLNGPLW